MTTSNQKKDIFRWVILLPITFILIVACAVLIVSLENLFLSFYNQNTTTQITDYLIMTSIPLIVCLCGYFIAPKFKFISSLVMMFITLIPFIESFIMENRIRNISNLSQIKYINFINPHTITVIILLFIVYKLEKIK